MKILCLIILFALFFHSFGLTAQEWLVPPDKAGALSPFKFSDETRKTGENLYTTYCKQCHGDPGKGNVIALVPPPPDPATSKMQNNSDGAIFYKASEGKGPMPSFKNILTTFNIWNIISYLRSFNPQYEQKVAAEGEVGGQKFRNTHIQIKWVQDYFQVVALVSGEKDNVIKPIAGTEIKLFAKRYFGNLLIDGAKTTDSTGKAVFTFPTDLPGDSSGFVNMYAKLSDEASFGEVRKDTLLNAGVPTWSPPLNEKRALWNLVQKAPMWLFLTYSIVVLTIWGFILYVIYQLSVIFILGKIKKRDNNL
jgi:mono/diheme cytochrome c family protein